jgi:ribosomal protein S27AE
MNTTISVTCPKCGNSVVFVLPPRTSGGKTEHCKKCANMVTIVFSTESDGTIRDIRLI